MHFLGQKDFPSYARPGGFGGFEPTETGSAQVEAISGADIFTHCPAFRPAHAGG
jgi:hypothetical protein